MNDKKFFFNHCFDKDRLKTLISWCFLNFGENKTLELLEKLKSFGFYFATQAGISLSIDDLTIPLNKSNLIAQADFEIENSKYHWKAGNLTAVEEFQQIIDTWHRTSETLRQDVVRNFRTQETLNPLSMMAFSGARGNISQVRQLVGMRGLMSDPQGQIIDFPIRSNFREGLTLIEYVISCYGARKGVVDTALRTANSGYLTRRLVDVAHHVVVGQFDCGTRRGSFLFKTSNFKERLVGRVIAEKIQFSNGEIISRNQEINTSLAEKLALLKKKILVRSPLTCDAKQFVCQLCYGWSLAHGKLVSLGEAVGILAAQSIGEPGTQLTMRTFHTGGVFSGDVMNEIRALFSGFIFFPEPLQGKLIRTPHGKIAFLTKVEGILVLTSNTQIKTRHFPSNEKTSVFLKKHNTPGVKQNEFVNIDAKLKPTEFLIPSGTLVFVRQNQKVIKNELLVEYPSILAKSKQRVQSQHKLNASQEGEVFFENVFLGIAKTNESVTFARKLSCFWILSGKLCSSPQFTSIFPKNGDFVEQNTLWSQWFLISPFNGFLQLNATVQNLRVPLKKNFIPSNSSASILIDKKHEIPKNNTVFLSQSFLYFSLFSIQYQKLGYFISHPAYFSSPIPYSKVYHASEIEEDEKLKMPLAQEKLFFSFSLQSQKQNLHVSNNLLYFRWFSQSLRIKAGRLLGLQNNFFDLNEYQGMILWVPEKIVFRTRRDLIFNFVFKNQQSIAFRINHQGFFEKEIFQKKNRVKIQTRFLEKDSIPVKFLKKDQFFAINKKIKKKFFKQDFFAPSPEASMPQHKMTSNEKTSVFLKKHSMPSSKHGMPIKKQSFFKTKNRFNTNLNFSRNFIKNPLSIVEKQIFDMSEPIPCSKAYHASQKDSIPEASMLQHKMTSNEKTEIFLKKFTFKKYSSLPTTCQNNNSFLNSLFEIKANFFFVKKYFFSFKKRTLLSITEKLYSELPTFQISYQTSKIFDLSLIYELRIREKFLQLKKINKFQQNNLHLKKVFFASEPISLVKTKKQQLAKIRNLFITKKFQKASKIISKSGWIYFPKKTFQISKINDFIIYKGNLLIDDIRFDQYSIYSQNGHLNCVNSVASISIDEKKNFIPEAFTPQHKMPSNKKTSVFLKKYRMIYSKNFISQKTSSYLSKKKLDKLYFFPVKNTILNNSHLKGQWYSTIVLVEKNFFGQLFFKNTSIKKKKDFVDTVFPKTKLFEKAIDEKAQFLNFKDKSQQIFLKNKNIKSKKKFSLIQYVFNKKTCWKFVDPFFLSTFYLRSFNFNLETLFQDKIPQKTSRLPYSKNYIRQNNLTGVDKTSFVQPRKLTMANSNWPIKNEIFFKKTKFKKVFKFILKKNKKENFDFSGVELPSTKHNMPFEKNSFSKAFHALKKTSDVEVFLPRRSFFSGGRQNLFCQPKKLIQQKQKIIFYSANFLISKKHDYFAQIQLEFFKIDFPEALMPSKKYEMPLKKNRIPSLKDSISSANHDMPSSSPYLKKELTEIDSDLRQKNSADVFLTPKLVQEMGKKYVERKNTLLLYTIFRQVDESISPDITKNKKNFYHQYSKNSIKKKDFKKYLINFTVNSPYFNKQNKTILWNKVIKKNFFNLDFQVETYLNSHLFNKGLKQQTYCMSFIVAPFIEKNYPFQNALFRISKKNFFSFEANKIGSDKISQFLEKITFSSILEYLVQKKMQLSKNSCVNGISDEFPSNKKTFSKKTSDVEVFLQDEVFLKKHKMPLRDIKFFVYQFDLIIAHTPFLVESFLSPYSGEIIIRNTLPMKNGMPLGQKSLILTNSDQTTFSLSGVNMPPQAFMPQHSLDEAFYADKKNFIPGSFFQKPSHEKTSSKKTSDVEVFLQDEVFLQKHNIPSSSSKKPSTSVFEAKFDAKRNMPLVQPFDFLSNLFVGEMLRLGEEIANNYSINNSGQIFEIEKEKVVVRQAQPFLASSKSIFHVSHGEFIETNAPLLTLFYQRLKTGDIVQGIPKIEELFEARQTKQGEILENNVHQQLKKLFYLSKMSLSTKEAVRQSFEKIRTILVQEIQQVYQSQGVTISEKHIEIIVRQMTSKVRILDGGKTGLLPDEFVDLRWLEIVNNGIKIKKAEYEPIVLGITKAALEAGSFISAASFQETTRVLTRAAIARKTDFLRGLKENVILGRLIPSGTGFSLLFPIKFSSSGEKNSSYKAFLKE